MSPGEPAFGGLIGRTYRDATPWWPEPPRAPSDAPNVVFVVLDDVGFAHLGCYGSDIATPHMDRLAAGGLRYTGFHTTAMCSPTRAALLTGRNHHSVGMGIVAEMASGYPAYQGRLSKRAATLAEVLREHGYNCLAVGKWHLMSVRDASPAGPFGWWPLQRGFERWYGFPSGFTDQFHPELYDGNQPVEIPTGRDYHLSEDLVDRAIEYVRDQQSGTPEKPFFLYVAFGAAHWPHQVPLEYVEKYRGRYDHGWDAVRAEWLARQKQLGIVPPDTELAPRDPSVPAWDSLTPQEQRLFARHMEVYAGFLEHTDAQIGRLVDYLEQIGQLDNTLIALISDNGASDEGGRNGCVNVYKHYQNRITEPLELGLAALERLGDETTSPHYPAGWAQAGNTPLKWYKKDTHGGGVRDPLIVHWPARIQDRGGLRTQYHHAVDIFPTVLEVLGIEAPTTYNGIPQLPVHGLSMAYTFDSADAPTRKQTQYYEMLGDRAIWHRGWKAVARHESGTDFDADRWELYHLDEDYAETRDLADQHPDKLRELIERWWVEAGKYDVLPLDDRDGARLRAAGRPAGRNVFTFYSDSARVERVNAPDVTNRSHSITAEVEIPPQGAAGVILAAGGRFGGYVLFVKDRRLVYEYNFGDVRYTIASDSDLPTGSNTLRFEFAKSGQHRGNGSLLINGRRVGSGELPQTWRAFGSTAGLHCGRDPGSPVSEAYEPPFPFSGTIHRVVVELADDQQRDPTATVRAALTED